MVLAVLAGLVALPLGVALGVVGSFLVPLRVDAVIAPVSIALALGGNFAAGLLVGTTAGSRLVAALPGLGWFAVVLVFASSRPEGDLVVPGTLVGGLFIATGAIAAAVAVVRVRPVPLPGRAPPRRREGS